MPSISSKNSRSDISQTLGIDKASGHARRLRWWIALTIVALAVAATVVIWRITKSTDSTQYKTQEVRRGDLTVTVTATGTLEPTNQVDVGIEVSGTIKAVEVDYNDRVKVGQALARLDTTKLEAQVLQSQAALKSAQAKVLEAQATVLETGNELERLKRVLELNPKGISGHDLDASEAAFKRAQADEATAEAEVAKAKATLKANETDLKKAVIRSPINGIVLKRSVEPGQTVAASFQAPVLFTLAEDLTQMELQVDVDEADIGQVQEGQQATFTVDAYPDRRFLARITQVRYGSQTVEGVVTYKAVLAVNNSDLSLRPGMTATASIIVEKIDKAILVPNAALRYTPPVQERKESSRGLVGMLLPRPPRQTPAQRQRVNAEIKQRQVWILQNRQLLSIPLIVGKTDGIMTEVLEGDVEPGMALVIGTASGTE